MLKVFGGITVTKEETPYGGTPVLSSPWSASAVLRGLARLSCVGALLVLPGFGRAETAVLIETLVDESMVFPGDVELYGFRHPVINDAGYVAFESTGVVGGYGVWRMSPDGALTLFLHTGIVPPGAAGGATLWLVDGILLPESGDLLVVTADLQDGSYGVFQLNDSAEISTVAIEGNAAPGTDGAFDRLHPSMRVSDAGEVAFHADLDLGSGSTTISNSRGIWGGGPGTLDVVARRDVDTGGPGSYAESVGEYPRITPDGIIALTTTRVDFGGSSGHVRTGTIAGTSSVLSTSDGGFWDAVVAENGTLAFVEQMGTSNPTFRVRVGAPGNLRTVIDSTQAAPGVASGRTLVLGQGIDFDIQLRVNRQGQVAFATEVVCDPQSEPFDECRDGIWSEGSGELALVAFEGDVAPGGAGLYESFYGLEINDLGQVAFVASTSEGGDALYFANPGEASLLVVRDGVGALFEYGPGDERAVGSFAVSLEWSDFLDPNHHGGLNDAGELVFNVETDQYGSGLYLATLPEPGPGAGAFVALVLLACIRRPARSAAAARYPRRLRWR